VIGDCDTGVPNTLLTFGVDICFHNEGNEDFVVDESGHSTCGYAYTIGGNGCTIADDIRICHGVANRPSKWLECIGEADEGAEGPARPDGEAAQPDPASACSARSHGDRHPQSVSHTRRQGENRP
jgi:hypothetical protein